jgi:predicted ATPase/class 3 adenylate cyclase
MAESQNFGIHTFLFTDIADSSRLWQEFPKEMSQALAVHDDILQRLIPKFEGQIVKSTGDGVHASFDRVSDAAQAGVAVQQELLDYPWQETGPLLVRMGLHTGDAEARDGDYYGTSVNKAARVMSLAAGGQILLSDITYALLDEAVEADFNSRFLGTHRLKGLTGRTGIYQLIHPDLPDDFAALKGGEAVPNNLPGEMTSFIGREQEIDQIVNYLLDTEADPARRRLVTLIGPGGTGKTRLSIQAARAAREAFPDGVWLVELAALTDQDTILSTLLNVLDLHETSSTPALKMVTAYLRDKQALLIFDNCEHLIDACAQLIEQILQVAPLVQVLASSREALGVSGETIQRIQSLPLPESDEESWGEIQKSTAIQLFMARAESANAQRWLTAEYSPAIVQICRRLDGIPLAIEMAAARLKVFSPAQILERLDDRFRLLTGGSRTALPRLQTLQALIDWSYDLLTEEEQGLFNDLSVFSGGWTIEMALDVCSDWDVYSLLPQLVDKSLIIAEPQGDSMRYQFLETIRQYARIRLMDSGRSTKVRDQHLTYFVSFSEPDDLVTAFSEREYFLRLLPNLENCRSALTWGIDEDPLSALELAGNLVTFWGNVSVREGISWVDKTMEKAASMPVQSEKAEDNLRLKRAQAIGFLARGLLMFPLGHNEQSFEAARESIELYTTLDDELRLTVAYSLYGLAGISIGRKEPALEAIEAASVLEEKNPNQFIRALLLNLKGLAAIYLEMDIQRAREIMEEAIALEPAIATSMISGTFALIKIQSLSQNWDRARELVEMALDGVAQSGLMDNKRRINMYQAERGHIERQSGNLDAALNIYSNIITSYQELGMDPAVANLLECFAMIAVQKGQRVRAGRLFGAAEALRERIQADMMPYERMEYEAALSNFKSLIEPDELSAAWQSGRSYTMDQAIDEALRYAEYKTRFGD